MPASTDQSGRPHLVARLLAAVSRRQNPLDRLSKRELEIDDTIIRAHELRRPAPEGSAQSDRPTFVLIHGLGLSSQYFVPLAEHLADHGRVLLFDLPGFAGLPKPDRPLEIADHARILRRALDALDVPGEPVLIGHSMGSQVVVELLAADPEYARYAMLLAPVLNPTDRRLRNVSWRFVQSAIWENPLNTLLAIASYVRCPPGWIADTLPRVLAYPMVERLDGLPTRIAIVGGRHDHISSHAWQKTLIESLTGAEVITLPHAAHAMVVDHAERLASVALRLIDLERHGGDGTDAVDGTKDGKGDQAWT